jgi:hypothetical protein
MYIPYTRGTFGLEGRLTQQARLGTKFTYHAETTYPEIGFRPREMDSWGMKELEKEYQEHLSLHQNKTPVDIMVSNLYKAMIDQQVPGYMFANLAQRYCELFPDKKEEIYEEDFVASDIYRGVLAATIEMQADNDENVDLENVLVEFFGGSKALLDIFRDKESTRFVEYAKRNDGDFGISRYLPDGSAEWVLYRWLAYNTRDAELAEFMEKQQLQFSVFGGGETYSTEPIKVKKIERFNPSCDAHSSPSQTSG